MSKPNTVAERAMSMIACILLIVVSFNLYYKHFTIILVHAFNSPCYLYASVGKQPTVTFATDIYTPVAVDERSKQIWPTHAFMKLFLL